MIAWKAPATLLAGTVALLGCSPLSQVGKAPTFTPPAGGDEYQAMMTPGLPERYVRQNTPEAASLWNASRQSLLGDRRAEKKGDILTVVVSINDSAAISDSSNRSRSGSDQMSVDAMFGLPEKLQDKKGISLSPGVATSSSSSSQGKGAIARTEKVTLRIAATVLNVLPNGVLEIQGTQEVRVNYELRELTVTGYVRAEDVSRQNEITYDKIASARISYGGRGQITQVQQPRYGQQVADIVLPF